MSKDGLQRVEGGLGGLAAFLYKDDGKPLRKGDGKPPPKNEPNRPRYRKPGVLPPDEMLIKKEEKTMTGTGTATSTSAPRNNYPDRESCPICGWGKPKEIEGRGQDGVFKFRPIGCKGCHDKYGPYVDEATTKLAKGEKVVILSWHEWVLSQLDLSRFEQELAAALTEKDRLNELVQARINEAAKLQPGGRLSREVFISLRDKIQMEKFPGEERTARDAYAKWRRLEARLAAAKVARPEVEKMVADEVAKNSLPPAPPAAEPAAADTAPGTTTTKKPKKSK